jgi:hypothetical protein
MLSAYAVRHKTISTVGKTTKEVEKMRKILVVLLAILVAGGLFAQVTFTGDVKSGLNITQSDENPDDKDPKVKLWNDDAGQRFYINGAVDFDDDFGLAFGFYGKPDSAVSVAYDYARLYGEFLNDMLKLTFGTGTGGVWGTGGKVDTTFDDTNGIKLEIKPITGLDVGFQLRTELAGDQTVEQWLKETIFGAKYDVDLFKVVAAFRLDSDYDGTTDKDDIAVLVAFDLKDNLVPGLTVSVQGAILGLGDLESYGFARIGQNVGYQVTPALKVSLGVKETLNLRKTDNDLSTFRIDVEPAVSFKLSDLIALALNVTFATGGSGEDFAGPDVVYDVGVKPAATFTLNDHASIYTYYKLGLFKADVDGIDAITKHTIQVNFGWSF